MIKLFFDTKCIILSNDPKVIDSIAYSKLLQDQVHFRNFIDHFLDDEDTTNLVIFHQNIEELLEAFYQSYKVIEAGGGLVFNSQRDLLVIRRLDRWELPKGKIEIGENADEAALREVEEECGISGLQIIRKLSTSYHFYEGRKQRILKLSHWFLMHYSGNQKLIPQTEEGITQAFWAKTHEIENLTTDTFANLIDLFQIAIDESEKKLQ